ncbi:hypothetical protein [Salinibacterium sp. PAMC 21357]|uniref:hypothetical protein n=1 Tax=Salinibacterium sp. PAMC 21357 TaxID=1112215 RepID=UPI000289FE6F|nr:hypothetical protein [Salinibacterium sp. PAMC 21357]
MNRAGAVAAIIALSTLLFGLPASAANSVGKIELSDDGVSFSANYPGSIFDDIANIVPGDSQSETIYVRNTGSVAGYLRITLRDVYYSDANYGNALSVTTSTPANAGSATAISSASPCLVTHEGTVIAPGQTVPVVATLALSNLNGLEGQGATADLALRFTLSDTTPGALLPTECGTAGTTVPANPPSSGTAGGSPLSTTVSGGSPLGYGNAPTAESSRTATSTSPEAAGSGLIPALPSTFSLDPNTWRLYQEYLVLILVLAAMIGAGISWLIGRRSRRDAENG